MSSIAIGLEQLPAYFVAPERDQRGALILIHEIWGLTDHIKDVANRLCAEGYAVLAPDLLAEVDLGGIVPEQLFKEMADPALRDEAQKKVRAVLAPIRTPAFAERAIQQLRQCFTDLQTRAHTENIAVMGFCFGGTYAFALATVELTLKAVVPFYGQPPAEDGMAAISAPILAFYGEKDQGLMESLPALQRALQKAGKEFQAVIYPERGHAFFNDSNPITYDAEAAADAWQKTLTFLKQHLA